MPIGINLRSTWFLGGIAEYEQLCRKLYAWDPVGGGNSALGGRTVGLDITAVVGKVKVNT